MKKKITALFCVLLLSVLLLPSCASAPYDKTELMGKTSAEVIALYGDFDVRTAEPGEDGLYRDSGAGYLTKTARVGCFGTDPEEYYLIRFDENGVACAVEENYVRPGG